jgi:hypothetical protein
LSITNVVRTHVLRDLRPYICTFEDCRQADQLFDTFQSWHLHEIQAHGVELAEPLYGEIHESAGPQGQGRAPEDKVDRQLPTGTADDTRTCPLCLLPGVTAAHVGAHLQRIAIFALPLIQHSSKTDGGEDEDSNEALGSAHASSTTTTSYSGRDSDQPLAQGSSISQDGGETSHLRLDDLIAQEEVAKQDIMSRYLDAEESVTRKASGAKPEDPSQMPYLPLDPQDIGRTYEAIIRANSQSGKGSVAWVIQRSLELDLPRGLQVAFSKVVQKEADAKGRELLAREIQALFEETYHLKRNPRFTLVDYSITAVRTSSPAPHTSSAGQPPQSIAPAQNTSTGKRQFMGVIAIDGVQHPIVGVGNGAISSLANALHSLGIDLDVADYKEHAIGDGRDVKVAAYIECTAASSHEKVWGVGIHEDVVQASLIALLSAASSVS